MAAPLMAPRALKLIWTYLPNLLLLSLRTVLALPNASSSGFDSNTFCSMLVVVALPASASAAAPARSQTDCLNPPRYAR